MSQRPDESGSPPDSWDAAGIDPEILRRQHAETIAPKDAFTEKLILWMRATPAERQATSLTHSQLGGLESVERLICQKHSLIENCATFYRNNPTTDAATGVLVVITILSDNNNGYCTLGVERLAKLLSRDERRIRDAIKRLVAAGVLNVEAPAGKAYRYWPVVSRDFVDSKASSVWFVDAFSPAPQRRGRPNKTPDTPVRPLTDKPRTDEAGVFECEAENPGHIRHKPRTPASTDTTIDTSPSSASKNTLTGSREVVSASLESEGLAIVTASHEYVARAAHLANHWNVVPGSAGSSDSIDHDRMATSLRGGWAARSEDVRKILMHGGVDADINTVTAIVLDTLRRSIEHGEDTLRQRPSGGASRSGTFSSFFSATWQGKARDYAKGVVTDCNEAKVSDGRVKDEAKAGATKQQALKDKIAANAALPKTGPMASDGQRRGSGGPSDGFAPDRKLGLIKYHSVTGSHANMVLRDVPGSTVEMIEDTFIKVTENPTDTRYSFGSVSEIALSTILNTWKILTWKAVAYAKYGTPDQLVGGAAERIDHSGPAPRSMGKYKSRWIALSQKTIDDLVAQFPDAGEWKIRSAFDAADRARAYDAKDQRPGQKGTEFTVQPARYGTTLQAEFEAYLRDCMAKAQAEAETRRKEDAERAAAAAAYEAKQAEAERERREWAAKQAEWRAKAEAERLAHLETPEGKAEMVAKMTRFTGSADMPAGAVRARAARYTAEAGRTGSSEALKRSRLAGGVP